MVKNVLQMIGLLGLIGVSPAHETGTQLLVVAPGEGAGFHAVWNVEDHAIGDTRAGAAAPDKERVAKALARFFKIAIGEEAARLEVVSAGPSDSGLPGYAEVLFTIAPAKADKNGGEPLGITFRFPGGEGVHKLPPLKVKILDKSGDEEMGAVLTPASPSRTFPGADSNPP